MNQTQQALGQVEEIGKMLEPMIRRVIREELTRITKTEPSIFYFNPDTPIYKDMEDIIQRKTQGHIKLHSHEEVWSE
ncbi:MAG: hypothetical protein U9N77_16815 [Thermodesulfobacteriota bacterium]|nr:hypothetical protein [Thermodesulfobacteriota bacterium]